MADWADEKAEAAVAKIFEDLRDRRFLKWLFKEDVDAEHCIQRDGAAYALDKDVQDEIAATWAGICATALRQAHEAGRREGLKEAAQRVQQEADEWLAAYMRNEWAEDAQDKWAAFDAVNVAATALRALAQEGGDRG